jgi:hypothetical protein
MHADDDLQNVFDSAEWLTAAARDDRRAILHIARSKHASALITALR